MSQAITLVDLQKNSGAVFGEELPTAGPLHYGNPHGEFAIAESEAAVIDFSDRCHLELAGGDRVKFLQNFCTNDLTELNVGAGCEAFLTSLQGKVLAHLFIFCSDERLQIESAPGTQEMIFAHLDKYLITEDVEIRRCSEQWGEFLLTGPDAAAELETAGISVADMAPLDHRQARLGGLEVELRRVDWTSQPGYLLKVQRNNLGAAWVRLLEANFRPVGSDAFEAQRIEACMPLDRQDITEDNLAQEVSRTDRTISFSKGCYLGQEPIARIDALGHVNRELRVIRLTRGPVPAPGSPIFGHEGGDPVGEVTSAAMCFRTDLPLVMGYLRRNYLNAGSDVFVQVGEELISGSVFWK